MEAWAVPAARRLHRQPVSTAKEDVMETTELKTKRDELRVKLHLAEMDAKETWEKLVPRLHELERRVCQAGDRATTEIGGALERLRASLRALRDQLG
jgi:hypothetical protein